jgi:hypothetical protein
MKFIVNEMATCAYLDDVDGARVRENVCNAASPRRASGTAGSQRRPDERRCSGPRLRAAHRARGIGSSIRTEEQVVDRAPGSPSDAANECSRRARQAGSPVAAQPQQYDVQSRSHHDIALQSIHMTGCTSALEELWNDAVVLGLGEAAAGKSIAEPSTIRKAPATGKLVRAVGRFFTHPLFGRSIGFRPPGHG